MVSAGEATLKSDPFSPRIQRSAPLGTTNYLYDGQNVTLLDELDNDGSVVARYTQGPGIDQPLAELRTGSVSYYQQDGLGSISSLSGSAGSLSNTYTYDSYGKQIGSTGTTVNSFEYDGRELDVETGIYQYRARYYNSYTGRFLSEDPIGFDGGANFYAYVENDPVNLTDPMGLKCPCFAQLKYRATSYFGYTHAFWWVQDSNGTHWVIDGGPSRHFGRGSLNSWVNQGDAGHYGNDSPKATTWFDSGVSDAICGPVDAMLLAAERWPNNTILYVSTGPNSNTFAHLIGLAGGFDESSPPGSIGW
jgi:RHS repeat-associated protein